MSGDDITSKIEHSYFVTDRHGKAGALQERLEQIKGIEIQRVYKFIPTVAVRIENQEIVDVLKERYEVEQQHTIKAYQRKK